MPKYQPTPIAPCEKANMASIFTCPSCGAPLDVDRFTTPSIRCPYCRHTVILPPELRKKEDPESAAATSQNQPAPVSIRIGVPISLDGQTAGQKPAAKVSKRLWVVISVFVLIILCASLSPLLALPAMFASTFTLIEQIDPASDVPAAPSIQSTVVSMVEAQLPPTAVPTPAKAELLLQFGEEGSGPGYFEDARSIAVDGGGNIYVGQYLGGRVQAFDPQGKFITQWLVDSKAPLRAMAAAKDGTIYLAQGGNILVYDGSSGTQKDVLDLPNINVDDIAVALNGDLLVSSYLNSDDLVRLSVSGEVKQRIDQAISSQSGDSELDMRVAIDGSDRIYALGSFNQSVFIFTPEGRFVNRFGSRGNEDGQFNAPSAIAVDNKGNIYIADMLDILIFDSSGRFLEQFAVSGGVPSGLAFDAQNNLYVVARTTVLKYRLNP